MPSGKGERSIINHMGCAETGLLDNFLLLFRGSKSNKDPDYHAEMNWDAFSHWCETKQFPVIENAGLPSVVILDRATYHTVLDDEYRWPVTSCNKKRLNDSIYRFEGISDDWPFTWRNLKTNAQLLQLPRVIYLSPRYKIQKIAVSFGIKTLFLLMSHPELNPIEMVWIRIQGKVTAMNLQFNLGMQENETRNQISNLSSAEFSNYAEHILREERKYRLLSNS